MCYVSKLLNVAVIESLKFPFPEIRNCAEINVE
jgi:hypothetical protein